MGLLRRVLSYGRAKLVRRPSNLAPGGLAGRQIGALWESVLEVPSGNLNRVGGLNGTAKGAKSLAPVGQKGSVCTMFGANFRWGCCVGF